MYSAPLRNTSPPTTWGLVASLLATAISIMLFAVMLNHLLYSNNSVSPVEPATAAPIVENEEVAAFARTFFMKHSAIPAAFGISVIREIEVRCGYRDPALTDTTAPTERGVPKCTAKVTVAESFTVEQPLCVSEESGTVGYAVLEYDACRYRATAEHQYIHLAQPGVVVEKTMWLTFSRQANGWEYDPPNIPPQNKDLWKGALIEHTT